MLLVHDARCDPFAILLVHDARRDPFAPGMRESKWLSSFIYRPPHPTLSRWRGLKSTELRQSLGTRKKRCAWRQGSASVLDVSGSAAYQASRDHSSFLDGFCRLFAAERQDRRADARFRCWQKPASRKPSLRVMIWQRLRRTIMHESMRNPRATVASSTVARWNFHLYY